MQCCNYIYIYVCVCKYGMELRCNNCMNWCYRRLLHGSNPRNGFHLVCVSDGAIVQNCICIKHHWIWGSLQCIVDSRDWCEFPVSCPTLTKGTFCWSRGCTRRPWKGLKRLFPWLLRFVSSWFPFSRHQFRCLGRLHQVDRQDSR